MHINVYLATESEPGQYLVKCARIRNVTVSHLVNRLVLRTASDQLVQAVLDDEEAPRAGREAARPKWTRSFREIGD